MRRRHATQATISRDISDDIRTQQTLGQPIRAQYIVIFLSDGAPSFPQIDNIESSQNSIESTSASKGSSIHDISSPVPGT